MKRKGIVFLFVLLTASFIAICDFSYRSGQKGAYMPLERELTSQDFYIEEGFNQEPHSSQRHSTILWDTLFQRNAKEYRQNRSFYGSPPSIPHPISKEMSMGGKDCLQCHKYGGFVDKWKAYTPISPHPEMVNCRQCHVPQKSQKLFKKTHFVRGSAPESKRALLGSPPSIPHSLQMRTNCLSCHAGPSAPKEISVTHPERMHCRQCHTVNRNQGSAGNFFKRNNP